MRGRHKGRMGRRHGGNMGFTPFPVRLILFLIDIIKNIAIKVQGKQPLDEKTNSNILSDQEKEKAILQIARAKSGRVTIADIAMETSMTLEQSKTLLEKMSSDGVAELHVTDGGSLVYAFTSLISEEEKATAKAPLLK